MSDQEIDQINTTEKNDNLTVEVTQKPRCRVKFEIKATPKAVEAAYQKAAKNVSKEVSIPGFRKGKAPEGMIREKYGDVIYKEFIDITLQTGFNEAIHLTGIHPLKDGEIKRPFVHDCSREKGAHFTIEFEARPTLSTIKLEDLEIKKIPEQHLSDQEKKNAIEHLQLQFATYDPIEDRAAQDGDFVNVTVDILGDKPRQAINNQRTQINATGLPAWLREKVIGLSAGESAEGMTGQDPLLIEKDPHFQSLPFKITVHSIWKGNLPDVDDDFAKKVGLQTKEELLQKMEEKLNGQIAEENFEKKVAAIEKMLVEACPIDLPESYINANKDARLNSYLEHLGSQNRECSEEELKEIEEEIEKSAIYNLQLYFILRKIATDYHISIANEDIIQELNRQIALMSSGRHAVDFNDQEKAKEQLNQLAFDRKVKQLLVDTVKFVD